MRVVEVDPHESRRSGWPLELRKRQVSRFTRAPFGPLGRQLVVIEIETAREAEAPGERKGGHERGRPVAGLLELLRDHRVARWQEPRILVDAVAGRIKPGHHRAVRRQRLRHRRVGLTEPPPPASKRIEGRCLHAHGLRSDRIGARRVERDQQNRWSGGRSAGGRRRLLPAGAGEREGKDEKLCSYHGSAHVMLKAQL